MQQLRLAVLAGTAGVVAIGAMASGAFSAASRDGIALLEPIANAVSYRLAAAPAFSAASESVVLHAGDAVRTDASGSAYITYADGTTLVVEPNSDLVVNASGKGKDLFTLVTQNAGRVWYQISRTLSPEARYEVHSGALAAVVRAGTYFSIDVTEQGTNLMTVDGSVETISDGQTMVVPAGSSTTVLSGSAPAPLAPAVATLAPAIATPPATSPTPFAPPSTPQPVPTLRLPPIPPTTAAPTKPVWNRIPLPAPTQRRDPQPAKGNDDRHGHGG